MVKGFEPSEIAALLPVYEQGEGNGTLIICRNGNKIQEQRRVRTLLRKLARKRKLDLQLLSDEGSRITGRKNLVPIAIAPQIVFLPLKTRKPLIRGDGAYGYFNLTHIAAIDKNSKIYCVLASGIKIPILMRAQSISQQVKDAIYLSSFLTSNNDTDVTEEAVCMNKLLEDLENL